MELREIVRSSDNVSSGSSSYIPPFTLPRHFKKQVVLKTLVGLTLLVIIVAFGAAELQGSPASANNSGNNNNKSVNLATTGNSAPVPSSSQVSPIVNNNPSPVSDTTSDNSGSSVKVTVNGSNVPVPSNGSIQQSISSPGGGTTNVNVSSSNTTSSDGGSSKSESTQVDVSSSSSSSTSNSSVQSDFPAP